jgi:predicted nucleotidyltransferase
VEKIILFGSRARGEAREDTDYDILVVIDSDDRGTRRKLWRSAHKRLVRSLKSSIDLILTSLGYWKEYKDVPGTILYSAEKEGVPVA